MSLFRIGWVAERFKAPVLKTGPATHENAFFPLNNNDLARHVVGAAGACGVPSAAGEGTAVSHWSRANCCAKAACFRDYHENDTGTETGTEKRCATGQNALCHLYRHRRLT